MARKSKFQDPAPVDNPLFGFTVDFFRLFGAEVVPTPSPDDAQALIVHLGTELGVHFGQAELLLSFHGEAPTSQQELVAHGSRVFDQMLAFLARHSSFSVLAMPKRFASGEALMQALRPVNASVGDLRLQEKTEWIFRFDWRMTYRADDKRQELYAIVLDENGNRLPLAGAQNGGAGATHLADLLADAQPVLPERDSEGHLHPPKQLPLTQLVQLAESARKYATYHADLRCEAYESEILPRLHKVLNRLTTYYQQQIEEVYDTHDPDGERRRLLEADLHRKIAEEVENHRLRVQVELIGYLAIEIPVTVLSAKLSDGRREAAIQVVQNRYDGTLRRPGCHACGAELVNVVLDRSGHLICDACIEQCATCREVVCARCGLEPCPVCGQTNCASCGRTCWACGERTCPQHVSRCPTCGDEVCFACQETCAHCGIRQCRSHLYADCVIDENHAVNLICQTCAVRCPGCRQFTAKTGTCSVSGQRFCANCLVECTSCGCIVGPGFYAVNPVDRRPYCHGCLFECPTCGQMTPASVACATCQATGCPVCTPRCAVCDQFFCPDHSVMAETCGHYTCTDHQSRCAIGGECVCPVCRRPCAICERPHCLEHTRMCAQCGQEYCAECVGYSGICDTCREVAKHGEPVDLRAMPWVDHPEVERLVPYYRWSRLSNLRYTVYFGEGSMMMAAVIVVDNRGDDARVVFTRRLRTVERLRGMLGL